MMMANHSAPRLCNATLGQYRAPLRNIIVHLGLGAFARAHLASYTEDAEQAVGGHWGIIGVSLRHADQRDRLAPQDGLYTLLQRDATISARVIGCLHHVLVAPENPEAVIGAMADPSCHIISLTVTEKGYCHDPATGRLDAAHPDIRHDLVHRAAPRSAIGYLVASLNRRRAAGTPPPTILSCDNLPHNGALLAGLVQDFAARIDPHLATWIAAHVRFPATMVDRIVPATTDADRADAEAAIGLHDEAPVSCEPFRQWVIENRFAAPRPGWDRVSAQIVDDVAPFEHMKLRLLNGAHSALAYLGYLAGHDTIAATVADEVFRGFVRTLWLEEIIPVVPAPPGVDLSTYTDELLTRFANPAIRHRTWQIAMDGSQKLPQRLLATIRERLARNQAFPCLALAVAAWARYVSGVDERGEPIDVRDPLAAQLLATCTMAGPDPAERMRALVTIRPVFGEDLPQSPGFLAALIAAAERLERLGARQAAAS